MCMYYISGYESVLMYKEWLATEAIIFTHILQNYDHEPRATGHFRLNNIL